MEILEELKRKFPAILSKKLLSGEISFSDEVQFNYLPILAYRCITRMPEDMKPVERVDFRSNAEMGRFIRGVEHPESIPEYYGVSLFKDKQMLEIRQRLPKKNRKIVVGNINQEGGPALNGKDSHVCWWLFENADLSGFKLLD